MPVDEIDYLYFNDIVGFFGKIKKHEELAARGYGKITENLIKFYSYCQRLESEEPYIFQRRRLQYARSAQNCLINAFEEEGIDLYFQRILSDDEQENIKMAATWLYKAENINKNDTIIAFMRDVGGALSFKEETLEPIAEEAIDLAQIDTVVEEITASTEKLARAKGAKPKKEPAPTPDLQSPRLDSTTNKVNYRSR